MQWNEYLGGRVFSTTDNFLTKTVDETKKAA
jgi:hypothetical protein